ncbi:WAP four-disulfide core domain protein 6 [Pipistrellus kuhlii]|uniref:WAP four-disulfide core domain protein 6 n=1 Tax=Pipistrellus kuhlii TaxID=59472 RepID=UPI001E26E8D8|nr:WAP four-disulfide core domain protein 6 [Pipistrellus kuhlii]
MGLSGLLSILVLFILLSGVQEHGLVEGFLCKYWGLSPLSRERNSDGRKEQMILTLRNASPTPHPHLSLGSWHKDMCPKIKVHCDKKETNECLKNRQCPEKMKCCDFNCARKCLNLQQCNSEIP